MQTYTYAQSCHKVCAIFQEQALSSITQDTTILCSHRPTVAEYNSNILPSLFSNDKIVDTPTITNARNVPQLQEWVQQRNFNEIPKVCNHPFPGWLGPHKELIKYQSAPGSPTLNRIKIFMIALTQCHQIARQPKCTCLIKKFVIPKVDMNKG